MNYDVDGDALSDGLGMIEEGHIRKKGESERSGDRAGQRQSRSRSPGHVAERNGVADGPSVGSPPVSSTERSSRRHSHSRSSSQGYDTSGKHATRRRASITFGWLILPCAAGSN